MGIYLNLKNVLFRQDLNGEIYVDKSLIIEKLNNLLDTPDNYLCISRPRRFGKTMAWYGIKERQNDRYCHGTDKEQQIWQRVGALYW